MSTTAPGPAESAADALAARLAEEMVAAWQDGRCPPAEAFLARHPELAAAPDAAVRLIYEELCLREERGEEIDAAHVLARFPQWRTQLEVLLDCNSLLQRAEAGAAAFPEVGETFEGLRLGRELGRGAQGRVFLAADQGLGGRPVVLKVTSCDGNEHLSLARLQHTHIAPLYWMKELPRRRLRVLCMPYLGGATLDNLFHSLRDVPVSQRHGRDLIAALDRESGSPHFSPPPTDDLGARGGGPSSPLSPGGRGGKMPRARRPESSCGAAATWKRSRHWRPARRTRSPTPRNARWCACQESLHTSR